VSTSLTTARLRLVPLTIECTASPDAVEAIARATGARVPESWPVEHYDQEMLDHTRNLLEKEPETEYVPRYLVTAGTGGKGTGGKGGVPTVIGMVGCSAPDAEGRVMTGYSVVPEQRRRGYASEALAGIIEWVRANDPRVRIVVAETYPHLIPSIRTMEHCGLTFVGAGEGEGVIRYELLLR
jgi:RimJ/RimL family protein N-acetyltransferase